MAGVDSGCGESIDSTRQRDGGLKLVWQIDPKPELSSQAPNMMLMPHNRH